MSTPGYAAKWSPVPMLTSRQSILACRFWRWKRGVPSAIFMQQSIVRRTIGPPGMVRHLFNVRRVSMYHDGPQCPNYDGHSSTTIELSVSFVTYHYSILTNHYCPSDGRFIGKYAYACTHCTCILLQKQVQPCWILKLHFLTLSRPISLHSHKPPGPHCFEPICTCASNFGRRFPQLKYSMTIKLTFGSFDFSFKMNMNSKSKRFSYLGKLNTRERL